MLNDKTQFKTQRSQFVEATLSTPPQDKNQFRTLDRLFWLFWIFWIVLLLVLGMVLWFVFDPGASSQGLSTSDLACLANMTLPSSLSAFGKFVYAISGVKAWY